MLFDVRCQVVEGLLQPERLCGGEDAPGRTCAEGCATQVLGDPVEVVLCGDEGVERVVVTPLLFKRSTRAPSPRTGRARVESNFCLAVRLGGISHHSARRPVGVGELCWRAGGTVRCVADGPGEIHEARDRTPNHGGGGWRLCRDARRRRRGPIARQIELVFACAAYHELVRSHQDWDATSAALDRELDRSERCRQEAGALFALANDRTRAWSYLEQYVAGDGDRLPFDPARIATAIALRASVGFDDGDRLEDLTIAVIEGHPVLQACRWWSEVLWSWPGLPRLAWAEHDLPAPSLWERIETALPALGEDRARVRVAHLIAPRDPRLGAPWANLRCVASFFETQPSPGSPGQPARTRH